MNEAKRNDMPRTIVVVLVAVAALFLVLSLPFGINMNANYNGAMMGIGAGISATSVMLFLAKLLLVVFVVGLALGVIVEGKKLYEKQKLEKQETTISPPAAVSAQVCCTDGKNQSQE